MPFLFSQPVKPDINKLEYIWPIKKPEKPKWVLALKLAVDTIASFTLQGINLILPGVGTALDLSYQISSDVIYNLWYNDGNFDFKEFSLDTLINFIPIVSSGLSTASKTIKANKILSIAGEVQNETLANEFKILSKRIAELGTKNSRLSYKTLTKDLSLLSNKKFYKVLSKLEKTEFEKIFKSFAKSEKEFAKFETTMRVLQKGASITNKTMAIISDPAYAVKKALDYLTNPIKRKINTHIRKAWKEIAPVITKIDKKAIPLNSSVISSIRIFNMPFDKSGGLLSAVLYFRKDATRTKNNPRGKKPIWLTNKDTTKILNFLTTDSPMRHYLNNFAWGWDVGKLLRVTKSRVFIGSKLPLFASLLNYIAWSYKTIKNITNINNKIENNYKVDKFVKRAKDHAINSVIGRWQIPGLSLALNFARAMNTGDSSQLINKALKSGSKLIMNTRITNRLRGRNATNKNKFK